MLGQIYSWTDEQGRRQISDRPPEGTVKDLKVKGTSSVVKVGTKVRNIRLVLEAEDGHDIDCKIEGFGAMRLKSEFVRKA